ncbi:MAG: ABC transporter permease [Candidatus Komeilibacteria bacterium]
MTTADILQETSAALWSNKTRSGLTILGIVIGIGSVIAMIAIGQGAQGTIQSNIQSIGSNLILVMPGMQRGAGMQVSSGRGSARTLTQEDADAIAIQVSSVQAVAPEISGRYQIIYKGKNTNTSVVGTVPDYPSVRNVELDQGTFITSQNISSLAKVAVLGPTTVTDLFGEDTDLSTVIGQTIKIKSIEFKVIGVTKSKGGTGFGSSDDVIYVPLSTAQKLLAGSSYITTLSVQAASTEVMTDVQQQITDLLLSRHNITDPTLADFSIMNQEDIVSAASSVATTFTTLLAAVAGISLIVGGIGIMNMMLTTVTERTREIGLRKAVGGKKKDINKQFLIEAIMLTFIGGVVGVILGWLVAFAITYFGVLQTKVSLSSVLIAFGVSAAIGIVFGYYPARRAASLNPIDALRHE